MIEHLSNVALVFSAIGCVSFVLSYQVLADWRSSALGRNVMGFMFVAAALLSVGVARAFVPELEAYLDWIRLVAYTAVAYIVWRWLYLLLKAQRVFDREDAND